MTDFYFVQPQDVLMLRGNKSFGDAGEHGEAVMPPWPSLFSGAFRSALLGQDAAQLARFTNFTNGQRLEGALGEVLGTPAVPGAFRINWVSLAQLAHGAAANLSCAIPLPADLLAFADADLPLLEALHPASPTIGSATAAALPLTARLRRRKADKPDSGHWLTGDGLTKHLSGRLPAKTITTACLYKREPRLGIALDSSTRTAKDGAIYTTEAIAFTPDAGFLIGIDGLQNQLPASGLLRLGGDGRGAAYRRIEFTPPAAPLDSITSDQRFRLVLATHGLFAQGSLPERVERQSDGSYRLNGAGFAARLACAAVPRHEVVSGWDLAQWQPKPAQRVAPTGSVYWFDQFEGDAGKLANWVAGGLWGDNPDSQRQAEGFNRAWLAAWPHHPA